MASKDAAALEDLLGDLDMGPDACIFDRVSESRGSSGGVEHFLGFAKQLRHRASEVLELINSYKEEARRHQAIHEQLITLSVARWIFNTNQIEFAGVATEGDTLAIISGRARAKGVKEQEVLQTFNLLKQNYSGGETSLTQRVFDVERLNQWHTVLFSGLLEKPGVFRKSGVATTNLDCSEHVYPHHKIIPFSTNALCLVVGQLAKAVEKHYVDPMERLLYTFALAAFAQFNFVDIHPYVDGNGRMCRFLSKFLLDSCCPLPFPMFENRNAYLDTLIQGRKIAPSVAPLPLAGLLLESASSFYRGIINRFFAARPFTKLLVGDHEKTFRLLCSEERLSSGTTERLVEEFNKFGPYQVGDVEIEGEKYCVKRYEDIGAAIDAL